MLELITRVHGGPGGDAACQRRVHDRCEVASRGDGCRRRFRQRMLAAGAPVGTDLQIVQIRIQQVPARTKRQETDLKGRLLGRQCEVCRLFR